MSNPMLAAIDAESNRQRQEERERGLRREYTGLLVGNDPAKAGRLLEVAKALGQSPDAIKSDLEALHPSADVAAAPEPPADFAKMSGSQLVDHACKVQRQAGFQLAPAAPLIPSVKDRSQMTTRELLRAGIAEAGEPRLPQEPARK